MKGDLKGGEENSSIFWLLDSFISSGSRRVRLRRSWTCYELVRGGREFNHLLQPNDACRQNCIAGLHGEFVFEYPIHEKLCM